MIFTTAFWNEPAREGAIANGATCYLEKRVDAQAFEGAPNQVPGAHGVAGQRPGSGSLTSNRVP